MRTWDNVGNERAYPDTPDAVTRIGVPVTKYYYANGQRVAMRKEGVVYYVHADHLGSTSTLSNENGEQVTDSRVAYLPYGGVRLGDASTLPTDYTFTGQRLEAGLGLMHYGARFYSSRLGRFISADTLVCHPRNPQAWNRYSYVLNNPLYYVDPTGHQQAAVGVVVALLELVDPLPLDPLVIPAAVTLIASDPSVQQALMYTTQHAQYYPAVADQVGNAGQHYLDKGGGNTGNADPNDPNDPFRNLSKAARNRIESHRRMLDNPDVHPKYRAGLRAQLHRAEEMARKGLLEDYEASFGRSRFDLTLKGGKQIGEVKYWTQGYTEKHFDTLAGQLLKYQSTGKEVILEMYQTHSDPITLEYWGELLEKLAEKGVNLSGASLLPPIQ